MNTDATSSGVLVTGAAGFIGGVTADKLVKAGYRVHAGTRWKVPPAGETCRCDLDNPNQIDGALAGVQTVIHTAYGSSADMAEQCQKLLAAMDKQQVHNLIYFSSIAVYGDQSGDISEDHSLTATDDYGKAKIACESLIRHWASQGERRAIILRPGIVYGRGSPFWINKLSERINCGAWGTFGKAGEGVAALVHVDDVAKLCVASIDLLTGSDREALQLATPVNVQGPEHITWNNYFSALAEKLRAPALHEISAGALTRRRYFALFAKIWRKLNLPGLEAASLAPTSGEIALFSRKSNYRTSKTIDLFAYLPEIDLQEGLERSFPG